MIKSIWKWIKSLFVGRGGFRCDSCGKWQSRSDGKATVKRKSIIVPRVGRLPASTLDLTQLHCKTCAK